MRYFQNSLRVPWSLAPIFRGSSSFPTRWWRNFRMRRATGFSSSFSAARSNSIFPAIEPPQFLDWHGPAASRAHCLQPFFRQVDVFELIYMLEDGFAGVVRFGAPGPLGEVVEAFFDSFGKADG